MNQPRSLFTYTSGSNSMKDQLQAFETKLRSEEVVNNFLLEKFRKAITMRYSEANLQANVTSVPKPVSAPSQSPSVDGNNNSLHNDKRLQELTAHSENAIAVVVFSCNRVSVAKCLNALLKYRPSKEKFPIIVSQDCNHARTAEVIQSYGDQIYHILQPDQSDIPVPPKEKKFKGYFKIARHYGWALNETFYKFKFQTAIIVEDDLEVAPDFFEYFLGTYPILLADPTLWCISAWNDNGKKNLIAVENPELLYRTDFFPGLGWMLTKSLWDELSPKWPHSYWDDWIRQPEQRKDRACIRPEVSRTKTFGMVGVSNGLFYEKHLKYIYLNNIYVPFTKKNLTYLIKDNYDVEYSKLVYSSTVVTYPELRARQIVHEGTVRIPYYTKDMFKHTARMLGLMDDFKSGVPRTSYRGIVSFVFENRRVFLAPQPNWKGYDLSWR